MGTWSVCVCVCVCVCARARARPGVCCFEENQTWSKVSLHLNYLKKQIVILLLKIRQKSQEDPRVLFLRTGPKTLLRMRNMEEIRF